MGLLLIIFIVIAVVSSISIASLYFVKDPRSNNIIFTCTVAMGILISYLNMTSLPSNFVFSRIVAGLFGILAIIGVLLKFKKRDHAAKLLVTASVVLGIVQLFFL